MRRAVCAVGAGVLLLALAGCAQPEPGEGDALNLGDSPGQICLARGGEEPKTIGNLFMSNRSGGDVVLTDVRLKDPDGLELIGSVIIKPERVEGSPALVSDGWPPYPGGGVRRAWRERVPAVGYHLAADASVVLWIGINAPSGAGRAKAVELEYARADSDRRYVQPTTDEIIISAERSCPEPTDLE